MWLLCLTIDSAEGWAELRIRRTQGCRRLRVTGVRWASIDRRGTRRRCRHENICRYAKGREALCGVSSAAGTERACLRNRAELRRDGETLMLQARRMTELPVARRTENRDVAADCGRADDARVCGGAALPG